MLRTAIFAAVILVAAILFCEVCPACPKHISALDSNPAVTCCGFVKPYQQWRCDIQLLQCKREGLILKECECVQAPESVSGILKPVVALYAMKVVETNLGWYLSERLLSPEVGTAVSQQIRYCILVYSIVTVCAPRFCKQSVTLHC